MSRRETPTIAVRRSSERGHFDMGWLDTRHTFSFGDYHDPDHMGFRALRVINEDRIAPGGGFGTHPHRDMEILTYVTEGALEHKDSMGTGSTIRPGEVQRMSAGTGVFHSEHNASKKDPVRLLQIWILPETRGLEPSYEQRMFPADEKRGKWRLVASRDGREGSVRIHQDVSLYATLLSKGERLSHAFSRGRSAWLQVVRGGVTIEGNELSAGDGLALSDGSGLALEATSDAELLLFDLA
ncbi:pirin family protein [bacterium]|nr:pirin family protein [bacterium]